MLSTMQLQRSRERLLRACEADLEPNALRFEIVAELQRAIGFAFWCWPLVDPVSLVPTGGLCEHPVLMPVFGRYMTIVEREPDDINSYASLLHGASRVGLLAHATGGDIQRSRRVRELYQPLGLRDELRVVLRDGRGCWGYLNLHRAADDQPFDVAAAQFVSQIAPALAAGLRRSLHRGTVAEPVEPPPPGVLILDDDLRLRAQTPSARPWLQAMAPAASTASPAVVPPAVASVAARLLGQEAGVDPHRPPRSRVHLGPRRWAVVHAARLEGEDARIAVTIESAHPQEVLDLLCQAWGLSPRERALLELVIGGLETGQIAARLSISPHTVQDHLKTIFDKVGVHSRRELVGGLVAIRES
jgi:DNA-binding CsgD family transcriptional regulator